jgi:hypothetical protein
MTDGDSGYTKANGSDWLRERYADKLSVRGSSGGGGMTQAEGVEGYAKDAYAELTAHVKAVGGWDDEADRLYAAFGVLDNYADGVAPKQRRGGIDQGPMGTPPGPRPPDPNEWLRDQL